MKFPTWRERHLNFNKSVNVRVEEYQVVKGAMIERA
jgi:hypothetical protein